MQKKNFTSIQPGQLKYIYVCGGAARCGVEQREFYVYITIYIENHSPAAFCSPDRIERIEDTSTHYTYYFVYLLSH